MHPYEPARGHVLRRLFVGGQTYEAGGEYEVDDATAELLLDVHAEPGNPATPLAFVPADRAGKTKPARRATTETTLTSADLPQAAVAQPAGRDAGEAIPAETPEVLGSFREEPGAVETDLPRRRRGRR
jgi:hypothetical protein